MARWGSILNRPWATEQTGQFGFGGFKESELIARAPERSRNTYLEVNTSRDVKGEKNVAIPFSRCHIPP